MAEAIDRSAMLCSLGFPRLCVLVELLPMEGPFPFHRGAFALQHLLHCLLGLLVGLDPSSPLPLQGVVEISHRRLKTCHQGRELPDLALRLQQFGL